jgi:hypothetical protein
MYQGRAARGVQWTERAVWSKLYESIKEEVVDENWSETMAAVLRSMRLMMDWWWGFKGKIQVGLLGSVIS